MINTQQFAAAQQAQLEATLELTRKAFAAVEKVVELNMATARATLADSADIAKAALAVKDPQSLMALQASQLQPAAEKATAYGRHLADIAKEAQIEAVRVAEAQVSAVQQGVADLLDAAAKNAPAGTESGMAIVRQAVEAANTAYGNAHKAARQAAEVVEANLNAATDTALKATRTAAKGKRAA